LKALLVSRGVKVSGEVYEGFGATRRLSRDPLQCNSLLLPDATVVQLTDLAFHMAYIKHAMSWDALRQLRFMSQLRTPFSLELDESGDAVLFCNGGRVTEVSFPAPTSFYRQETKSGLPFLGNAVLQGTQWLSFPLLWQCDYACAGQPCQYCYSGGELEAATRRGRPLPRYPTPADVAGIVEFAIVEDSCADSIQITGGSTFDVRQEYEQIEAILRVIDERVGRASVKGDRSEQ
jgi:hypothetical protein